MKTSNHKTSNRTPWFVNLTFTPALYNRYSALNGSMKYGSTLDFYPQALIGNWDLIDYQLLVEILR